MSGFDFETLKNPPVQYRGMPFWSWNGKLEAEELLRQVQLMKEMGFGGFFIHSRTGLITEYMGEEWFKLTSLCAREAERLGMHAYLYDEDRWPSGISGGLVTADPRCRSKFISMKLCLPQVFSLIDYGQEYIRAFAVRLCNGELDDYYPVTFGDEIKEGYAVAIFYVEEMQKSEFFNGYTYADLLNREATDRFIELTHERYKAVMGEMFGKEIIGIFTDEPHRGCMFGGFGLKNENKANMVPYTYKLFDVFKQLCGYGMEERLPELYFKKRGEDFSKVSYDYVNVVQQMFLDNFAKPYHEWCRRNKLIVTGHILHENNLSNQTAMSGSVMRYYEYMDYPGVDILKEHTRNFWVVKQVYSVAKQLGKPFILSELYGCTGWEMSFERHKFVGDWQAVLGINFRCHHLSWYTMEGEGKRDYPASIFYQSAWYDNYNYIEEYFARMGFALSQGSAVTDTLVISPIESVWGHVHKGCFEGLEGTSEDIRKIEQAYVEQFHAMTDACVDFDYADEDIFARHGESANGGLRVGRCFYKTVVVSGLQTIRESTLSIIGQAAAMGCNVVFCGIPEYVDGVAADISTAGYTIAGSAKEAAEICSGFSCVRLCADTGGLLSHIRKLADNEYIAVVLNTDRERGKAVELRFNLDLNMQEYDLRNGKILSCPFQRIKEGVEVRAHFEKGGEKMYLFTSCPVRQVEEEIPNYREITLSTPLFYTLSEPNILILDIADFYLDGMSGGRDEILRIDDSLRKKLNMGFRGGEMIQPWFREKYLKKPVQGRRELKLDFDFYAEHIPDGVSLACESPEKFEIFINGQRLPQNISGYFIDPCFKTIGIPAGMLNGGRNILSLLCGFDEDINLEAVYLIGAFGVSLQGSKKTITKLADRLDERPLRMQGLPFYSGKIILDTGIKKGMASVRFPRIRGAYAEVDFGDVREIVAFSPYGTGFYNVRGGLKFTLCLTRRNTFGPLHLIKPIQLCYGPFSFRLGGELYTEDYTYDGEGIDFPIIKFIHSTEDNS